MNVYYVYAHYTLDTNECFYIGVGTWTKRTKYKRAYKMSSRNKLHTNIASKHDVRVEIIKNNYISRDKAVDDEIMLQLFFKPRACFVYGDNNKKVISNETRAKMSAACIGNTNWLGKKHTNETKVKISKSRKGHVVSSKTKIKIGKASQKQVINCRGQIFESPDKAAKAFGLKGSNNIYRHITGKNKSAGKYIDGTKVTWGYYEPKEN